jgi:hypothetical protein
MVIDESRITPLPKLEAHFDQTVAALSRAGVIRGSRTLPAAEAAGAGFAAFFHKLWATVNQRLREG